MDAIGFAGPAGPKSIQPSGTDLPSGEPEPGGGVSSVGAGSGVGFGATLAKISRGGQGGTVALEDGPEEPDAASDLLADVTTGLIVPVSLLVIAGNQEQDPGQGLAPNVGLPVFVGGDAAATDILPTLQGTSPGAVEIGTPALPAVFQGADSQGFLGPEAQMPAPRAQSSEARLSDAVLRPDVVGDQVVAEAAPGEVVSGEAASSAVSKPDHNPSQILSVRQEVSKIPQPGVGRSNPALSGDEEIPGVGQGSDHVLQALSNEAPQSAAGEQLLEREGHGGDQERGASQGQGEVKGAPSPLDASTRGAEVLVRPGEPAFRSELTKAAERGVSAPVEPPAPVVSQAGGTMRLQFEPPDLGRVTVQVSVQAQQVHATVSVQHQGLGEFLTTSQGALDDAMRQHGLRVEEFRVDTDPGQAGQGQLFGEHLPGFQDREGAGSSGRPEAVDAPLVEVRMGEEPSLSGSLHRINLFA